MVRGASQLARTLGISPLLIGLTVVAFGTSSPELVVSVRSTLISDAAGEIALGNIVGSNIINVLFILGLSAAITPLAISQKLVRLDVPIMIGCSTLALILAIDRHFTRFDGVVLFTLLIVYILYSFFQSRNEDSAAKSATEFDKEFSKKSTGPQSILLNSVFVIIGVFALVIGANWLVRGAVALAHSYQLSELVIGLTIVALGTSLPEVATSVMASIKGERDIAVGNIVGSNIFNILSVLGLTALVDPNGIHVSLQALRFDMPFMVAVAVACLPIFFTGYEISRWEGILFLIYYVAYTGYLILTALYQGVPMAWRIAMLIFVVPITIFTIVITIVQHDKKLST